MTPPVPGKHASGVTSQILQVDPNTLQQAFSVAAGHPALAGHFPGRPIVPGVVLLDQVILMITDWLALDAARSHWQISNAKFLSPVLPGDALQLQVSRQPGDDYDNLRFELFDSSAGERRIASGALRLQRLPS